MIFRPICSIISSHHNNGRPYGGMVTRTHDFIPIPDYYSYCKLNFNQLRLY